MMKASKFMDADPICEKTTFLDSNINSVTSS